MERKIFITEIDLKKIKDAILLDVNLTDERNEQYIQQLEGELERATIVPPHEIPADVITVNSHVILYDMDGDETMDLTLVFPGGPLTDDSVSVLAPIGTAMLGYRTGDIFEWDTPGGKRRIRVEQVLFQPESSGIYD